MTTLTIAPSYIWTATSHNCVGSKVGNINLFECLMVNLIGSHDPSGDRSKGQHFIMLSSEQIADCEISCGVGLNTQDPSDYHLKLYRGRVQPFLKREQALPVSWCAVIVYDRSAYLADPQMTDEERQRVLSGNATHFLVALLANADGVPNAYGTYRLVSNLCGGNNDFKDLTLDEIRDMAQNSLEYENKWCVVAD